MTATRMAAIVALATALMAAASSTHAQSLNRAWVSGKGTDAAGCGAPTAPCRSFQYVHDHIVAAGGEIDVLDGAGYGAVAVTKSLSIVGVGTVAAVQQPTSGANAITITAGASDAVHLRGLTLDGLGVANEGIRFNSGASLDIVDCVVRHFSGSGVQIAPSTAGSKVSVTDTLASDNVVGIVVQPLASVRVAMKGVIADNNSAFGVDVEVNADGASAVATAIDSEASGDVIVGFNSVGEANGASSSLSLRNVTATNDGDGVHTGQFGGGTAQLTIGRSLIAGDTTGADDNLFGGTILSFGDNRFNGNGADVSGGLTAIAAR